MIISLMTYNIRRLGEEKSKTNLWKYRKKHLIELIKKHNPDILCLQEDHPNQIGEIKNQLPQLIDFGFYNEDIEMDISGETNSILFNSGKFSILEKKYFYLTETPDKRSSFQEQSIYHRTITYVELATEDKNISVFNTHFDHLSSKVQQRESKAMLKIISSINPTNYIICGDFNGDIESPQLEIIKSNFILINKEVSNRKTVFDWSEVHPPRKCIDFIFSNIRVRSVKIDDSKYLASDKEERAPSDHLPIICNLDI